MGHMYKALHDSGIHTFIDDENLQRGEKITPTIVKAVEGKAFQNMQNLKTLIIRNGNFSKGPEYLPDNLRVLE